MGKIYQKSLRFLFKGIVLIYTVVATIYFLKKPAGSGDELLFINDLLLVHQQGWIAAIEKGISILYILICYPFTFLMPSFIALRLINVLLFLGLLVYFFKWKKIKQSHFYFLLLFFFSTVGYFLSGTNDPLFFIALIVFFVETYFFLEDPKKGNMGWWIGSLLVAFFTRELFVVFLPVVIISVYMLRKKLKLKKRTLVFSIVFVFVMLFFNSPSLIKNHTLSYDAKLPPRGITATWAQRQYYAQLLVNEGKLKNQTHPSWQQTQSYIDEHGVASLPTDTLSGIFFDIGLTIKEFFKDFLDICLYGSRQLGLILPIVLIMGFLDFIRKKKLSNHNYIPAILLTMMCIFALITISFVEVRWFAPLFVVSILFYCRKVDKKEISQWLVSVNYGVIFLLSLYGIYGLFLKM